MRLDSLSVFLRTGSLSPRALAGFTHPRFGNRSAEHCRDVGRDGLDTKPSRNYWWAMGLVLLIGFKIVLKSLHEFWSQPLTCPAFRRLNVIDRRPCFGLGANAFIVTFRCMEAKIECRPES